MIRRGLMKATYLLVLIVFIAGMFKQGKDGGELVYEYGANVERVQDLDSELFDVKEELEEAEETIKTMQAALKKDETSDSQTKSAPTDVQDEKSTSTTHASTVENEKVEKNLDTSSVVQNETSQHEDTVTETSE
jgi:Skp family chaperone for outer membrane proteins